MQMNPYLDRVGQGAVAVQAAVEAGRVRIGDVGVLEPIAVEQPAAGIVALLAACLALHLALVNAAPKPAAGIVQEKTGVGGGRALGKHMRAIKFRVSGSEHSVAGDDGDDSEDDTGSDDDAEGGLRKPRCSPRRDSRRRCGRPPFRAAAPVGRAVFAIPVAWGGRSARRQRGAGGARDL